MLADNALPAHCSQRTLGISVKGQLATRNAQAVRLFLKAYLFFRIENSHLKPAARRFLVFSSRPLVGIGRMRSLRDRGAERTSNDADVSSILPFIPSGGFSPVRLEGWLIRRHLSVRRSAQACSRHTLVIVRFASVLRALRGRIDGTALSRACGLDCALP